MCRRNHIFCMLCVDVKLFLCYASTYLFRYAMRRYQTVSVWLCQQDNCNSSSGWRLPAHENIRTFCKSENMTGETNTNSLDWWISLDIDRCVRENTLALNSTIKQEVMEEALWSSYMASVLYGMCHTFLFPRKVEANQLTTTTLHSSLFYLDPSLNYRIIIHDPKFYHILTKYGIFPRIWLEYKTGQNMEAGN